MKLLEMNIIPIINENDTIATNEIEFGDNDTLSAIVAALVGADLLVILSDIDGLYSADPRTEESAEIIHSVLEITPELRATGNRSRFIVQHRRNGYQDISRQNLPERWH